MFFQSAWALHNTVGRLTRGIYALMGPLCSQHTNHCLSTGNSTCTKAFVTDVNMYIKSKSLQSTLSSHSQARNGIGSSLTSPHIS
jgi:hypothetical protein